MTAAPKNASPVLRPPSVDRVLGWPAIESMVAIHGRTLVRDAVREALAALRQRLEAQAPPTDADGVDAQAMIVDDVSRRVEAWSTPSLRRVFNLTGTVLHTNLGRAPLPPEAIEAVVGVASGASNLEFDLDAGRRGDRDDHVERWLCRLTGAQAATVVNNNAAAVLLALTSLARRREVVISRGELVEIGGAFRLPDIMAAAGCRLREVGTTNRTHPADFAGAIGPKTALLMKAHTSNYRIEGFTAEVATTELARIARELGVPLLVDLGSGTLTDLERLGLPHETTPAETIAAGAHLVTFSGDKLLGGPQAGIVVGDADLIRAIKRNPMKRAMRCDKLTLAALEAVLRLYGDPDRLVRRVPALRLLARSAPEIETLARRVAPVVARHLGDRAAVDVVEVRSQIGSGALPVDLLPSFALRIVPATGGQARRRSASGGALERLAAGFRALPTPVIGRIADGAFLLDLRCLEDEAAFVALFGGTPT